MGGKRPPQVGTLGTTIADGLHLTIVCDAIGCHHRKTVDLEALRRDLGEDYRIADFVARAKCGRCQIAQVIGQSWADPYGRDAIVSIVTGSRPDDRGRWLLT